MATLPADKASSRIITLDIIRGIAVMGIFSVNVVDFAMIQEAYLNPAAYGGWHGGSLLMWAANVLVIDGKMRALFSMLFGASMLVVIDRAEAAELWPWSVHARRMTVLALFGIAHYYLLWSGDILLLYALTGLIAFRFRDKPVKLLVMWGCVFLATSMVLLGGFTLQFYQQDIAAHAPNATRAAIESWNEGAGAFYPTAAQIAEDRAAHLGSWTNLVSYKLQNWSDIIPQNSVTIPETLAMMLFGMAALRSGLFTGDWDDRAYRRLAVVGIAVGLAAHALTVAVDILTRFHVIALFGTFVVAMAPFRILMAMGYAALIILLTRRRAWLAQRIAAAGRCAFTNYLGTSLIAAFVFYGWGLGLYASVSRWESWLLVPAVWLLMLTWSKPWLDRFNYGPFEWLWRSFARWQLQPMRRRS